TAGQRGGGGGSGGVPTWVVSSKRVAPRVRPFGIPSIFRRSPITAHLLRCSVAPVLTVQLVPGRTRLRSEASTCHRSSLGRASHPHRSRRPPLAPTVVVDERRAKRPRNPSRLGPLRARRVSPRALLQPLLQAAVHVLPAAVPRHHLP